MFPQGNSGGPIVSVRTGKVVGIVDNMDNIPQLVPPLQPTAGSSTTQANVVPYATFSRAISITELKNRLPLGVYSFDWATPKDSKNFQ